VNDSKALADAAQRLASDPDLRARLSQAAAHRAAVEFNHRTMAQRSIEVYRRTIIRGKKIVKAQEPTLPKLSSWVRQVMQNS
jgi:hypothetical protein